MTAHWILNMSDTCHSSEKLGHWAVLLDFLCKNTLCSEGFMRCHEIFDKAGQTVFSNKKEKDLSNELLNEQSNLKINGERNY